LRVNLSEPRRQVLAAVLQKKTSRELAERRYKVISIASVVDQDRRTFQRVYNFSEVQIGGIKSEKARRAVELLL